MMVARLCQTRRRYLQQVYKAPVTMVRAECGVCGIRRLQTVSMSACWAVKLYKARCVFIVTKYRIGATLGWIIPLHNIRTFLVVHKGRLL
jgi:hypothetical protein